VSGTADAVFHQFCELSSREDTFQREPPETDFWRAGYTMVSNPWTLQPSRALGVGPMGNSWRQVPLSAYMFASVS
jgi:hypothetical protein